METFRHGPHGLRAVKAVEEEQPPGLVSVITRHHLTMGSRVWEIPFKTESATRRPAQVSGNSICVSMLQFTAFEKLCFFFRQCEIKSIRLCEVPVRFFFFQLTVVGRPGRIGLPVT